MPWFCYPREPTRAEVAGAEGGRHTVRPGMFFPQGGTHCDPPQQVKAQAQPPGHPFELVHEMVALQK